MEEEDNIIRILTETEEALEQSDSFKLKRLSDETIHSATIYQDTDNIVVAVLVYSLAKIIEREGYRRMEGWDVFYNAVTKNIKESIIALEKNDVEKFAELMGKIRRSISQIDGDLSMYIQDIFHKAEINKAYKLYEHGLSAEKTATLLGVSLWDLSSYIGQTTISESHFNEAIPVKDRIKLAEKIFS